MPPSPTPGADYRPLFGHSTVEAALLAKAWGVSGPYIVNTVIQGAYYFTGWERLDMAAEVLEKVLD